jgi:hypothetical protein
LSGGVIVLEGKQIRNIIGYTHSNQLKKHDVWYNSAISFYEAALVIHDNDERITSSTRVFVFNAGLSIELILKAILAAKRLKIRQTHNLQQLAKEAGVNFNCALLKVFTTSITWLGRYPVPNKESDWDDYNDILLEKISIHEHEGNTYRTLINPDTFPTIENYKIVWEACLNEYKKLI